MTNKHFPRGAPPLLAVLLLLGFLFSRCDKSPDPPLTEEEKLPPATQEGKGTFGCLVDGKAWVPRSGGLLQPGIEISYNEIVGSFQMYAVNTEQNIRLNVINARQVGVYSFLEQQTYYAIFSDTCDHIGLKEYTDYWGGRMEFTKIDFNTGVISGLFEFTGINSECQDTVEITQGRFDIKYK